MEEKYAELLAACDNEWDLEADEALLATLTAFQEEFMSRLSSVKSGVDDLCNDVSVASCNLQNAVNQFSLLSQTQFVENRCGVVDDASDSDSADEKEDAEPEDRVAQLYADAIELSAMALEKRSIPLFDSDEDDESDEEEIEDEEGRKEPDGESSSPGGSVNGESGSRGIPARNHYRHRPLVAIIGTPEFLGDPYCGLHKGPPAGDDDDDGTETTSSDSEAEPVVSIMQRRAEPSNADSSLPPVAGIAPAAATIPQVSGTAQVTPAPPPPAAPPAPPQPTTTVPSFQQSRIIDSSSDDDAQPIGSVRDRVLRMYERYNPDKLHEVDNILSKFVGREKELMAALVKKYGPEPPAGAMGAGGSRRDAAAPQATQSSKKIAAAPAFGGASSDSDAPGAPRTAPKPKAKTSVRTMFGSDSDSSDEDVKPKVAAVPKKAKAFRKNVTSDDSDSSVGGPPKAAPAKKLPPPPAKKAAVIGSSSSDDDDAPPKAAPAKKMPPPPAKKAAVIGSSSSDDDDAPPKAAPAKKMPPPPPKRLPGKKTVVFSSDDSDTGVQSIVPRPKPKPKGKASIYSSESD